MVEQKRKKEMEPRRVKKTKQSSDHEEKEDTKVGEILPLVFKFMVPKSRLVRANTVVFPSAYVYHQVEQV